MKRSSKGRSEERTEIADWGCGSGWWDESPGRRRGRLPPNWYTRPKAGPPPKLKTNWGPPSKPGRTLLVGLTAGMKIGDIFLRL
jgi:hypothetical protein